MTETTELKPCPFCGGEAEIIDAVEAGESAKCVTCKKCWCSSHVRFAIKEPVEELLAESWNQRAPAHSH